MPGLSSRSRAALLLAVLFYAIGLARGAMERAARREALSVRAQWPAVEAGVRRAELELEKARGRHLARYLEGITPLRARQALASASRRLEEAERERWPERIRVLAGQADWQMSAARDEARAIRSRIAELDEALSNYKQAPTAARAALDEAERRINSLVSQGYYASHFVQAKELLSASSGLRQRAERVAARPVERGLPDYVLSYELASLARYMAEEAERLAAEVPALRARNAEALERLPARIRAAREAFPSAVAAARQLAGYGAYRGPAGQVMAVEALLGRAASLLGRAERLNAMEGQRFAEARQLVDTAESLVLTAERNMQWALDSYRAVVAAVAALSGAAAEADREIERAESRIQRYSRNSQDRARSLLDQARASARRGLELAEHDPVAALNQYKSAGSLAQRAYAEVNTSSGDGSHVHWGGGGGSSGGGGGPSGGFSGGPSGGFSGGPSGGGVGGGGF